MVVYTLYLLYIVQCFRIEDLSSMLFLENHRLVEPHTLFIIVPSPQLLTCPNLAT